MLIPSWWCSKVIYFREVISGESGVFMNGISECPCKSRPEGQLSLSLPWEDTVRKWHSETQKTDVPSVCLCLHTSHRLFDSRIVRNKRNCLSLQFMVFCYNSQNRLKQMDVVATKTFPHRSFFFLRKFPEDQFPSTWLLDPKVAIFFLTILGTKPRTSDMLDKCIELHHSPNINIFNC